jgi:hypothetical protein
MASFISLKRLCEFLASFFRWIWDLRASINTRGLSMMAFLEARLIGDSKANDSLKDATIMNAKWMRVLHIPVHGLSNPSKLHCS